MKVCLVAKKLSAATSNLVELFTEDHRLEILLVTTPSEDSSSSMNRLDRGMKHKNVRILTTDFPTFDLHIPFLCAAQSFLAYFTLVKKSYDLIVFDDADLAYYSSLSKVLGLGFLNTRMAITFHIASLWGEPQNPALMNSLSGIAQDFITRESFKMAEHVFFESHEAKKTAMQDHSLFANDCKFSVVPNLLTFCDTNKKNLLGSPKQQNVPIQGRKFQKNEDKKASAGLKSAFLKACKSDFKIIKKSKKFKKLSVCIIFFDRPNYLSQCVQSLDLREKCIDEVLIYVNSDEKQESKTQLEALKKHKKIRLIRGHKNVSPGRAQNFLTREARNECLLFLDDDNILNFKAFKKLWNSVDLEWDIICCALKKFDSVDMEFDQSPLTPRQVQKKLEKISYAQWLPLGKNIALSIFHNYIGDNNFLIKKSHLQSIGGVNEEMLYNEDAELIIRSLHNNGRYFLSPESFIYYRKHSQNLSTKKQNSISKDLKSMRPVLRSINCEHLLPVLFLSKRLINQRSLNSDRYELGQIELASKFRKYRNQLNSFKFNEIEQTFRNKISYSPESRQLSCLIKKSRNIVKSKSLFPDGKKHFIIYSEVSIELFVNSHPFKFKKGYNAITVVFDQKQGILISMPLPSKLKKIDFVEVEKLDFERRL